MRRVGAALAGAFAARAAHCAGELLTYAM